MIISIIVSLILFIALICSLHVKDKTLVFWISVLSVFFLFVLNVIMFASQDLSFTTTEKTNTGVNIISSEELSSFKDTQYNQGQLIYLLGSGGGTSTDVMYYRYYVKTEYGYEYKEISPKKENVYIRYCGDNELPRVEEETDEYKLTTTLSKDVSIWTTNFISFFKYYKYDKNEVISVEENQSEYDTRTIFYIPENSVQFEYDVDME